MSKLWCEQQMLDEKGVIMCTAHLAEGRVFDCPYNDNEERLKAKYPCSDITNPVLTIEKVDLLEFDPATLNIKVSKDIFDDFLFNTCIDVKFTDDDNNMYQYIMTSEDNDGINMECLSD